MLALYQWVLGLDKEVVAPYLSSLTFQVWHR